MNLLIAFALALLLFGCGTPDWSGAGMSTQDAIAQAHKVCPP